MSAKINAILVNNEIQQNHSVWLVAWNTAEMDFNFKMQLDPPGSGRSSFAPGACPGAEAPTPATSQYSLENNKKEQF